MTFHYCVIAYLLSKADVFQEHEKTYLGELAIKTLTILTSYFWLVNIDDHFEPCRAMA